jgi:hypothetical protein
MDKAPAKLLKQVEGVVMGIKRLKYDKDKLSGEDVTDQPERWTQGDYVVLPVELPASLLPRLRMVRDRAQCTNVEHAASLMVVVGLRAHQKEEGDE